MDPFDLTDAEVQAGVRVVVQSGHVRWSRHAQERMAERGIDKGMVYECLTKGYFSEPPIVPNVAGDFQYKFTMVCSVDGDNVSVAASYIPATAVVVITVF